MILRRWTAGGVRCEHTATHPNAPRSILRTREAVPAGADHGEDIDDADGFPKAVIQLDCQLARPRHCRDYHGMDPEADWPSLAVLSAGADKPTRAEIGALRAKKVKKAHH